MSSWERWKLWSMERKEHKFTNLLGILSALGIAFGGLYGVQSRLAQEEVNLLQGGGAVKILVQDGDVEVLVSEKAERVMLSEAELVRVVENLRSNGEVYPHEPWQGQLSMAQAIEYGKGWMEDFCMPYFGVSAEGMQEYKANCYLWSPREGGMEGEDRNELYSYWTVALEGKGVEAELLLHGESGQVLEASVSFLLSSESGIVERPGTFLQDYANSFGFAESNTSSEGENGVPKNNIRTAYQSIGSEGIYAAMTANLIMTSKIDADGSSSSDKEVFHLQLYLDIVNLD